MSQAKRRRITKASKPASPILTTRSLFPLAKTTKAQVVSAPNTQKRVFSAETDSIRVTTGTSSQPKSARNSKRKLVEVGDGEAKDGPSLQVKSRESSDHNLQLLPWSYKTQPKITLDERTIALALISRNRKPPEATSNVSS
jgi:hypothetical protein